jgi:hypothetical protein
VLLGKVQSTRSVHSPEQNSQRPCRLCFPAPLPALDHQGSRAEARQERRLTAPRQARRCYRLKRPAVPLGKVQSTRSVHAPEQISQRPCRPRLPAPPQAPNRRDSRHEARQERRLTAPQQAPRCYRVKRPAVPLGKAQSTRSVHSPEQISQRPCRLCLPVPLQALDHQGSQA